MKVTSLKLLNGTEIGSWLDSSNRYDVFPDCRRYLADWGNCDLDEVDYVDTDGGDFFTIDGIPVAYLDVSFPKPAQVIPFPMAAE